MRPARATRPDGIALRRFDRLRRLLPHRRRPCGRTASDSAFTVDVSNETLSKTTLGAWEAGDRINLERALKAGDELGGHIVSGHVDGVAPNCRPCVPMAKAFASPLELPQHRAPYAAPKGSIALDGTPPTVNEVAGAPLRRQSDPSDLDPDHLGAQKPGDEVNVEIDLFARYVARIMEFRA